MNGDHRAFLDATLPYLDVVCQVAQHAAGGRGPGDLVQETCLRACPGFAPLIAGAAPAFAVASSIRLRRFGTPGLSGRGPADAGGAGPGEQGLPCPGRTPG